MTPRGLITSIDKLPPVLAASISPEEKQCIENAGLLFAVTPHFASLAGPEKEDPIRRQFIPDPREIPLSHERPGDLFALDDPLGEYRYRAAPGLVHQYHDRALLLAATTCAGYCRHCFRRVWLASPSSFHAQAAELQPALAYLSAHPEIREILVSGGDPLTMDNKALGDLFNQLRNTKCNTQCNTQRGLMLRVCTRIPITEPLRVDDETIALFTRFRPLRLIVHINHPRELSAPSSAVLAACVNAGVPVHVQTVLMRGINDDPALLAQLFRDCLDLGLSPYYLFQMDLAPGTAHFRVPLKQGLAIYRTLSGLISGLGLPAYALDLPGGGGKIRLHENVIAGEKTTAAGTVYVLQDRTGSEWYYPAQ